MEKKDFKKTNWKTTDKRFVAFLDILGFKDKIMRNTHSEIYDELSKLSKVKSHLEKVASKTNESPIYQDADIYIVSFSDSIVIFSKNDDYENFEFFLISLRYFFSNAIANKIAIKGGMAYGEISLNKQEQIYFGQPIIDAYLLEEDVNYFGVVAHNSIDKYINDNNSKILSSKIIEQILFKGKTPLKCGKIHHTNLDWFAMSLNPNKIDKKTEEERKKETEEQRKERKHTEVMDELEKFNLSVSGSARRYVDNTIELFLDLTSKDLINLKEVKL
ncbi:hypothetical protein [Flavobacterium sp. H4147]|uniref:hypothetical protein n=1 Tax=Flavobacterium sp. H4147 TaxID=3034149 RepID=UPI0023EABDC8|nr:hypothetical protein [Flavobacterium sp. H4147]